jgi:phospholipase/carboxylesterase
VRTETFGELTVHLAGGSDREGGGAGPLVVLLHGFGAPGADLVPLYRALTPPVGTRFAFLEAPLELGMGFGDGRAWWMIDMLRLERALAAGEVRDLTSDVPDGLAEARAQVIATLDALQADLGVEGSRVVLGGFSQGAMLALDVALRTERALAGLVLLSGTLLAEHEWLPLLPKRAALPVLQTHGRQDPLLPFSIAERLHAELTRAGLDASFVPFNGGHEIPGSALDALDRFVVRALG